MINYQILDTTYNHYNINAYCFRKFLANADKLYLFLHLYVRHYLTLQASVEKQSLTYSSRVSASRTRGLALEFKP